MDVTDMAAIQDSVFSTGFLVFDQVKAVKGFATDHVEDLLQYLDAGQGRSTDDVRGGGGGPPLPPHVRPADRLLRQPAGHQDGRRGQDDLLGAF